MRSYLHCDHDALDFASFSAARGAALARLTLSLPLCRRFFSPPRRRRLHPAASSPVVCPRSMPSTQELEFPCSSHRAKVSPDGGFLAITGIHPPQARHCRRQGLNTSTK